MKHLSGCYHHTHTIIYDYWLSLEDIGKMRERRIRV